MELLLCLLYQEQIFQIPKLQLLHLSLVEQRTSKSVKQKDQIKLLLIVIIIISGIIMEILLLNTTIQFAIRFLTSQILKFVKEIMEKFLILEPCLMLLIGVVLSILLCMLHEKVQFTRLSRTVMREVLIPALKTKQIWFQFYKQMALQLSIVT